MAVIGSVRFVDEVGENYLSRVPHFLKDNDTKFDVASLKAAIKFERTWIPDRYYLVDINLVHAHEAALAAEIAFFNEHPSEGQLIWWDTNGTDVCCFDVTDPDKFAQMVATLDEWISDEPISRVDTLRSWLETPKLPKRSPTGVPYVFYVHCDGGCDRTGELIGTYRLRYMGWSWLRMWNEQPCNDSEGHPRPMGCNNYRTVQWYAFWLKQQLGFNLTDVGCEAGCSDPGGVHQPCPPRHSLTR